MLGPEQDPIPSHTQSGRQPGRRRRQPERQQQNEARESQHGRRTQQSVCRRNFDERGHVRPSSADVNSLSTLANARPQLAQPNDRSRPRRSKWSAAHARRQTPSRPSSEPQAPFTGTGDLLDRRACVLRAACRRGSDARRPAARKRWTVVGSRGRAGPSHLRIASAARAARRGRKPANGRRFAPADHAAESRSH